MAFLAGSVTMPSPTRLSFTVCLSLGLLWLATVTARADVKATVAGYAPIELANGITAGSRKVIVARLGLDAAGYPVPPKKGDRIYLGASFETPTTIDSVDADRREYQACYEISSAG